MLISAVLPQDSPPTASVGAHAIATFAGGCFWCMEPPFEKLPGVKQVTAGYTGGSVTNPTYEQVSAGTTGHFEAIEVTYDPHQISYQDLLSVFWQNINPTDASGQFADRGKQYRTAIFYHTDEQKKLAEISRNALDNSGTFEEVITTPILPAKPFFKAENYHQDYYRTNPLRYNQYHEGSGRASFLKRTWEKNTVPPQKNKSFNRPATSIIKNNLSKEQYAVAVDCGTEPPFTNAYWNNKKEGLYVDIITGEPLFCSTDKFSSGTGWPSFTRPISQERVAEYTDTSYNTQRIEIKSKIGGTHLGHLFNDGPAPGGLRYCINSASLRFIPKAELVSKGYAEYLHLFNHKKSVKNHD